MAKTIVVQFNGMIADPTVDEQLPIVLYKKGQDIQTVTIAKGDQATLTEDQFALIENLVAQGYVTVVEGYADQTNKMLLAGSATVWDAALTTPAFQAVTVNHTIGNTNYEVDLSDTNFQVVNVAANSFQIEVIPANAATATHGAVYYSVVANPAVQPSNVIPANGDDNSGLI